VDDRGNTFSHSGVTVARTGPDGTITLRGGDGVIYRGFGDFDGDGRGDFLVDQISAGDYRSFIVRGSMAPGVYRPGHVGVFVDPPVPPGEIDYWPAAVGDQDGDGADDVSFGPRVYSGRVLTSATGPGPQARLLTLPGDSIGLLQLDPSAAPTFVAPEATGSTVLVFSTPRNRLQLGISRKAFEFALRYGLGATGSLVDRHRIVQLSYGTRSGASQWRFDLDAPCAN